MNLPVSCDLQVTSLVLQERQLPYIVLNTHIKATSPPKSPQPENTMIGNITCYAMKRHSNIKVYYNVLQCHSNELNLKQLFLFPPMVSGC